MGQTLSEPITEKKSSQGNDKRVMYGSSCMQGWRTNMEDAHTIITSYANTGASFFAVFDGHGGDAVAKYCGTELYKKIMNNAAFDKGRYRDAIRSGYYGIDEDLKKVDNRFDNDTSGCTALVTLLTKNNVLYVSNAGDSRAIISTRNGKAIPLTQDHKPKLPKEEQRIRKAGGFVENGRVNGSLALSRAIGDFVFKSNTQITPDQQAVTAEPDIIEHLLTDQDEFVVMACDGIWDCLSNQQVVDFIRCKLCEHKLLDTICEELIDYCLADQSNVTGIGCDNMTVIIIAFLRKRKPQDWYDWMASKTPPKMPARKTILTSAATAAAAAATVKENINTDNNVSPIVLSSSTAPSSTATTAASTK
ncbi:phosphatase 2C-like domain-containing protein [Cokeromyces recurvatus]|uniref:phosphatase 2C-like domain-containing protein n=1 Tax=Cokeromyces recurvatus TaxID=90255 RepID=UPI002220D587|nr:phosphatase 2C-like domain-containing protein [Cokeromyces recurvatus]KAI7904261.1 phosphatase 2C-like domain-containing protein [Cokeromyces recurvatus]